MGYCIGVPFGKLHLWPSEPIRQTEHVLYNMTNPRWQTFLQLQSRHDRQIVSFNHHLPKAVLQRKLHHMPTRKSFCFLAARYRRSFAWKCSQLMCPLVGYNFYWVNFSKKKKNFIELKLIYEMSFFFFWVKHFLI